MARPTKPASVKLTKTARCRVTEAEFSQLEAQATAAGLSVADYMRSSLLKAKPKRRKASPERLALIAAVGTLGHIRADLNQILKDRWSYKFVQPGRVENACAAIEIMAEAILNDLTNGD